MDKQNIGNNVLDEEGNHESSRTFYTKRSVNLIQLTAANDTNTENSMKQNRNKKRERKSK